MPVRVMSQLETTSAILGEYMLKGWTLTDLHCDTCRSTPLMREPAAAAQRESRERIQFCALCDGRPEGRVGGPSSTRAHSSSHSRLPDTAVATSSSVLVSAGQDQDEHTVGEGPSQADEAASSISDLLLKGYSLLGDNCPNPGCKGIPLVGYPKKSDGSKDSRKMCVSCGSRWIDEAAIEKEGMKIFSTSEPSTSASISASSRREPAEMESPRSKARRELYGLDTSGGNHIELQRSDVRDKDKDKGKGRKKVMESDEFEKHAQQSVKRLQLQRTQAQGDDVTMEDADSDAGVDEGLHAHPQSQSTDVQASTMSSHPMKTMPMPNPLPRPINNPIPPSAESALGKALTSTSEALSSTLQNLSTSLESHTSRPPSNFQRRGIEDDGNGNGKWFVDLKLHTEAIKDVLAVLGQVERAKRVGY
ncbi:uncharacterized protein I303_105717 [Kwoniella dejecticola CBS 10117]|uniref:Uncharacterized protein n=1 Tax=Kwoniella dejecticola CBS 10117 TaxID=1296121 RepID=A0A1A6A075_9TREE|nr:uncharacterized protein I303_05738 [Kwoniella dejecticola CBS 10117]OBR83459.1 hypothetical protein I303_05738 [Kwoniella dejecticola CBS 10117]